MTKKEKKNTNPFDGPIDEDVMIVDDKGNAIHVPQDHQIGGSKDGKCIQVKDSTGNQTGFRKDGKGHPNHSDPSAQAPHGHVPGVTNSDGNPWLPIN